jgi:hypothetical protein
MPIEAALIEPNRDKKRRARPQDERRSGKVSDREPADKRQEFGGRPQKIIEVNGQRRLVDA